MSWYLEAFKKGVYDYIKEDYDPATQEIIPRKYFSGGFDGNKALLVYSERETFELLSRVQKLNVRMFYLHSVHNPGSQLLMLIAPIA